MRNYNPLPDLTGGTPLAWENLVNFKKKVSTGDFLNYERN
jgi:hypothetical protein